MATKGEIIGYALDDIGYSGDYDSALLSRGLRTLDRMCYGWLNAGLDIGYLLDETSDTSDESGLLFQNIEAVQYNLACRLADQLGLVILPTYRAQAHVLYTQLFDITPPETVTNPFMPLGAGQTRGCGYNYSFQHLSTDCETELTTDSGVFVTDDDGFVIDLGE